MYFFVVVIYFSLSFFAGLTRYCFCASYYLASSLVALLVMSFLHGMHNPLYTAAYTMTRSQAFFHWDTHFPPLGLQYLDHLSWRKAGEHFMPVSCKSLAPSDDMTSTSLSPPYSCLDFVDLILLLLDYYMSLQFQKYLLSTCISHSQISYHHHLLVYASMCVYLFVGLFISRFTAHQSFLRYFPRKVTQIFATIFPSPQHPNGVVFLHHLTLPHRVHNSILSSSGFQCSR